MLFEIKDILLHSGVKSDWKIECDALSSEDWKAIAYIISKKYKFNCVVGVPTGADLLAEHLLEYLDGSVKTVLIVDDVLTTGGSMGEARKEAEALFGDSFIQGVVLFSRCPAHEVPYWIDPIFQLWGSESVCDIYDLFMTKDKKLIPIEESHYVPARLSLSDIGLEDVACVKCGDIDKCDVLESRTYALEDEIFFRCLNQKLMCHNCGEFRGEHTEKIRR